MLPVSKGGFGLNSDEAHRLGDNLAYLFAAQPQVYHMRRVNRVEELPIFNPEKLLEGI